MIYMYGLKVNRWRPEDNNKEWASVTKEATLLGGPQNQGARKFYDFTDYNYKIGHYIQLYRTFFLHKMLMKQAPGFGGVSNIHVCPYNNIDNKS
jgi:hypothetical protein